MANSAQSRKRARQAEKHIAAVEAGDKEQAQSAYKSAAALIDKTANKGLIHKNKAARQKSRLNARIRAM